MTAVAMIEVGFTRKPEMQPAIAAAMAAITMVCMLKIPPCKLIVAKNTNMPTMSERQTFSAVRATNDRKIPVINGRIAVITSLPTYHSGGILRPRL